MRVLYIDTRSPGHNAELHVDFVKFLDNKGLCEIIPYGNNLATKFSNAIKIDFENLKRQFELILKKYNPDVILTYNKNGSSYEVGRDNVSFYRWAEDILSRVDLPKFHITTDYCRSGFREGQANWFKEMGYTASIFRHKVALTHPCPVDSYWLPFSVDAGMYASLNKTPYLKKSPKVAFLGSAFQEPDIYESRVSAIRILQKNSLLSTSKFSKKLGVHQIILGDNYHKFLEKHRFSLTCGGTCNFMTAKYFQIPALKSLLVCSSTEGLELFPKDTYILYSKANLDKLISDLHYYTVNKKEADEMVRTLHGHVVSNHNHKIRGGQLVDIFKKYI